MAVFLALSLLLVPAHASELAWASITVTGQVTLQDRTDYSGATVTLTNQDTQQEFSTATGTDGSYSIALETGTYSAQVEMPGYLSARKALTQVPGSGSLDMGSVTLLAGDVNGDDRIDILDLVSVFTQPEGDINEDGVRDIFDLVRVGTNFGKEGPLVWLLSRDEAIQILISQVIQPDTLAHYVLAFGTAQALTEGTAVAPYAPDPLPDAVTHLPYITETTTTIIPGAT